MTIKQREANRKALEMAATMVRNADLHALFAELYNESEDGDIILEKAQNNAVRRIERLFKNDA